jgi:hypothetical protein
MLEDQFLDILTQGRLLSRLLIPASMFFMVEFRHYLFLILPFALITEGIINLMTQRVIEEHIDCPDLL